MRRLQYAISVLSHPRLAWSYTMGGQRLARLKGLEAFCHQLGFGRDQVLVFREEWERDSAYFRSIEQRVKDVTGEDFVGQALGLQEIYVICRLTKPDSVVETGVAAGVSSACILRALELNGKGSLFSIDLPNNEINYFRQLGLRPVSIIPNGVQPGFAVPEEMRHRWNLILGETRIMLPQLLKRLGTIDLFFHDSEHTYEAMRFELDQAWKHVRRGGVILVDNSDMSTAVKEFSRETSHRIFPFWFTGAMVGLVR